MNGICIICRKNKKKFTAEHVIPAAIGGTLEIFSVCQECNSNLGKKFDEPFLRTPWVGLYRKAWNLKRQDKVRKNINRSIANPLKGAILQGDQARDYFISFNSENIPSAKRIPQTNIERTQEGWIGRIIVSKEDLERVKNDFFKKHGIDEAEIKYSIEELPDPDLSFMVLSPTAPVLLECLKIAYEFAVAVIPKYFEDTWALTFSIYLNTGKNSDLVRARLTSVSGMLPKFETEINSLKTLPKFWNVIMLRQYEGVGLISFVKIFDAVIVTHLSNEYYMSTMDKQISIFMNCIDRKHHFAVEVNWHTINLNIDLSNFSDEEEDLIKKSLKDKATAIQVNGNIPVYNALEELLHPNLAEIVTTVEAALEYDFIKNNVSAEVNDIGDLLFIKHIPSNRYLRLLGFQAQYNIMR